MALTDDQLQAKLLSTRDELIQRRLDVVSKPKPSYNIDGQEVKWAEYLKQLDASIKAITAELAQFDGPFEEVTVGYAGP